MYSNVINPIIYGIDWDFCCFIYKMKSLRKWDGDALNSCFLLILLSRTSVGRREMNRNGVKNVNLASTLHRRKYWKFLFALLVHLIKWTFYESRFRTHHSYILTSWCKCHTWNKRVSAKKSVFSCQTTFFFSKIYDYNCKTTLSPQFMMNNRQWLNTHQ